MNKQEFRLILEKAVSGDHAAIEKILKIYAPLINSSSRINSALDEDLRQHIFMHIIKNISKFKI